MKRAAALLLFLAAATAAAQAPDYADSKNNFSVEKNGGVISGGSSTLLGATDAVSSSPVRGGIIIANSTPKWVQLAIGGAGTQLFSNGTDVSWSAPSLLSTSHGDTLAGAVTRGGVIVGNSTPAWARVTVGTLGTYVGTIDGTDTTFADPLTDIKTTVLDNQEFCNTSLGQVYNVTGSGAAPTGNVANGGAGHPCTRTITVGAATGSAAYENFNTSVTTLSPIENGGGAWTLQGAVRASSIGDGTDVIKYYLGGCSTGGSGDCGTGMYLRYDRSVNTTNWYLCAASNGSRSCNDTTIAVVVGTNWTTYSITSNTANNQLSCTINGAACAAGPTTNLPGAGFGWGSMLKADKTAGATTTFTLEMDFARVTVHGMSR